MKNTKSILLLLLISISLTTFAQEVFNENTKLKILFDTSVLDKSLINDIEKFIINNDIGEVTNNQENCDLIISKKDNDFHIYSLYDKTTIFTINNKNPSITDVLINDTLIEYYQGFALRNLNLKNKDFEFEIEFISVDYNRDEAIVTKYLNKRNFINIDGVFEFEANKDNIVIKITNKGEKSLYFTLLEITSQGAISQLLPNVFFELLGDERKIEVGQSIVLNQYVFSLQPPYEKITVKGFASSVPLSFSNSVGRGRGEANVIKEFYNKIYTTEFVYKIIKERNGEDSPTNKKEILKDDSVINYYINEEAIEILKLKDKISLIKQELEECNESKETRTAIPVKTKTEEEKLQDFKYKALFIVAEDYDDKKIKQLKFPLKDAIKLKNILISDYTFNNEDIVILENPTNKELNNHFRKLIKNPLPNVQLLIFYAGHGIVDDVITNKGNWLLKNAVLDDSSTYYSNSNLKDYLSYIQSKNTLLISDACFSGSLFGFRDTESGNISLSDLLQKRAVKAMTSGLDKVVPDKSMFLKYLIKALKDNEKEFLRAGDLYNQIVEPVMANTKNKPQYEVIQNAGHEGGDFIFVKRKKS